MTTDLPNITDFAPKDANEYPKVLTCPNCDQTFIVVKKRKGKEQKFCTAKCTQAYHSEQIRKVREAGLKAIADGLVKID